MSALDKAFDEGPATETAVLEESSAEEVTEKGESDAETPAADAKDETKEEFWAKTAYADEKRKRQEAEAKLKELEEGPKKMPDPVADPNGYHKEVQATIAKTALETRIEISSEMMREKYEDYEAKESHFLEMAKDDQSLVLKMNRERLPAKFVYEAAAKDLLLKEIGNPVEYKEKLRQELLEEMKSATGTEQPVKQPVKEAQSTPSLANATGAGQTVPTARLKTLAEQFEGSAI